MTPGKTPRARGLIVNPGAAAGVDLAVELPRLGYDVCGTVDTADAAVEAAARERPDLVLIGLRLGDGSDGVEVARRITAVHDAVIVFLAAEADEAALARAFEVAAFGYLLEPFTGREFAAAIAMARARHARDAAVVRELGAASAIDPLTGLPNRRRLDEALRTEWRRCGRAKTPLSVVMVDIDRFKAVNDNHGHPVGDDCLVAVARSLATACRRAGDVVGRWGGDEFLAVLPQTDEAGASHVAAAMVRAVRDGWSSGGIPPSAPVTVSIGMATTVPGPAGDAKSLIEQADRGLFAAKREGRDGSAPTPA
jgi:diguanylate cyclase (GGDEF)-like protein